MTLDPRQPALNKEINCRPIRDAHFKTWPYLIFVVRGDRRPRYFFDDVEFTNGKSFTTWQKLAKKWRIPWWEFAKSYGGGGIVGG